MPRIIMGATETAHIESIISPLYEEGLVARLHEQYMHREEIDASFELGARLVLIRGIGRAGLTITQAKNERLFAHGIWQERVLIPYHLAVNTGSHQLHRNAVNGQPNERIIVGTQRFAEDRELQAQRYYQIARELVEATSIEGVIS